MHSSSSYQFLRSFSLEEVFKIMMFLHMTVMMVIMMMMGHARINVEFANQKVFGHLTAILFDERVNNALS